MKLIADCNGNIRHFFAKLSWREHFDPKEIEILAARAIPMLIPPTSVQGRRNNVLQYDISAYSMRRCSRRTICLMRCEG